MTERGAIALTGTGAGGPDGPEPASGLDQRRSSPIAKHTPGPWLCDGVTTEDCGEGYLAYIVKAPGGMLASIANARLIASAPELLEALEKAEQALWQYKNDLHYPPSGDSIGRRLAMASEAALSASAAIAKAQGEAAS